MRALNHVREREKAEISLEQLTPVMVMVMDAASVGFYKGVVGKKFLTIDGLLGDRRIATGAGGAGGPAAET